MPDNTTNKSLERAIKTRVKWLNRVISFIGEVTCEIGGQTHREEGSCNTHVIRELRNFAKFSFRADTGQSAMGGNTFTVWYHPDKKIVNLDSVSPVLKTHSVGPTFDDRDQVLVFETDQEWQTALKKVIDRKRSLVATHKRAIARACAQEDSDRENQKRASTVQEKVLRLKL